MINKCPNCGGDLVITSYKCNSCFTEVSGEFEMGKFQRLDIEDLEFIELFAKAWQYKRCWREFGNFLPDC